MVATAKNSIFISHVNGDPDAEPVFQALVDGLKSRLAPTHDAYEIAVDRTIIAGDQWRSTIYDWLFDCAAAVILVTSQAFDANSRWVSNEANFLTIHQLRRKDLRIIPILFPGIEAMLESEPAFKPGRLQEFQAIRYGAAPIDSIERLLDITAAQIKEHLPRFDTRVLTGLAAEIHDLLTGLPISAVSSALREMDASARPDDVKLAAELFLTSGRSTRLRAFDQLAEKTDTAHRSIILSLASLISCNFVSEADAKQIALQAAIPSNENVGRALAIDCTDRQFIELLLTRAALRSPHRWKPKRITRVQEFGGLEDLKKAVEMTVQAVGQAAVESAKERFRKGLSAIESYRISGRPMLFELEYHQGSDVSAELSTVRAICRDALLVYLPCQDIDFTLEESESVYCINALRTGNYDAVIGDYQNMLESCT